MTNLKNVSKAMMSELASGHWVEDVLPHVGIESEFTLKEKDVCEFAITYHRARGRPKSYLITVKERT